VLNAYGGAFPSPVRASIERFGFDKVQIYALNVKAVESVPVLFAVIMGLMGIAVLAHVLAVAARAGRREIAILRALGFSRGQTLRTVAWQSTIYAVGALAIGAPVGLLLGRLAWHAYAAHLGAVPETTVPVVAGAAVVAATLALACALSLVPALRLARSKAGAVLRTE
jgi:putative ABC transport system permease protein